MPRNNKEQAQACHEYSFVPVSHWRPKLLQCTYSQRSQLVTVTGGFATHALKMLRDLESWVDMKLELVIYSGVSVQSYLLCRTPRDLSKKMS